MAEWIKDVDDWRTLLRKIETNPIGSASWEVVGVRPITELTCAHAEVYAASSFWLRILLHMDQKVGMPADMPFTAAVPPCAACGMVGPTEAWCSAPLPGSLRQGHDDLVERMRALDSTLSPPPDGYCNEHHWDLSDRAKAAKRMRPTEFPVAYDAVVQAMLRDARIALGQGDGEASVQGASTTPQ